MWIDYNSNIHRRPQLLQAVRTNQTHRAIEEMETWITVHGKRMRSPNIVLAQAMYWSNEGLRQVVMNPTKIKRDAANDIVMWQAPTTSPAATVASVSPAVSAPTNDAPPVVPAHTNIRVTAGTAHNVDASQDAVAAQVAASTRAQLAGLRNLRSAPPSQEIPQESAPSAPSGPEHQTSTNQRRNWLNARNVRQVSEEPTAPTNNGIR